MDKSLYNLPLIHIHTPMATELPCKELACPSGATWFSVLPKDTRMCGQEELGIELPTLRLVDDPLLPAANKSDANKIVYIVYLLPDGVGSVRFKDMCEWTALDIYRTPENLWAKLMNPAWGDVLMKHLVF